MFLKSRRIWWRLSCATNFKPECLKNLWCVILVILCVVYPHIIYCPHTWVFCRKLSIIWQLMMMSELYHSWRASCELIFIAELPYTSMCSWKLVYSTLSSFTSDLSKFVFRFCYPIHQNISTFLSCALARTHRYFLDLYLFLRHRYLGEDFQFSGRVSLGQIDTVSMSLLLSLCFNMWQTIIILLCLLVLEVL